MIRINNSLSIPMDELSFHFSRSGGPGGQNVNRTATQVELRFDVRGSSSLTDEQKALIQRRLRSYVDKRGVMHIFSQATSSQLRNREDALERFRLLIDQSLKMRRRRIPTRANHASKQTRLERKRRRGLIKRLRSSLTSKDW
ncbi:MAG: aminoacyl-tRNA hydrolase [Anaerolineae bacterium]|nr:aminoacyl-tRNA hydrolase [Anaerolineae bacterium]